MALAASTKLLYVEPGLVRSLNDGKYTISCILRHVRITEWALLSFHSVFCLSVSHSATYSLPRLIDHNQIWSAGIYLSSDPCKPFWIPCLPYFGCQKEKYAKFRLFPMRILATVNVTHRAIWLVISSSHSGQLSLLSSAAGPMSTSQQAVVELCSSEANHKSGIA